MSGRTAQHLALSAILVFIGSLPAVALGAAYFAYGRTDEGDDSFYPVLGRVIK